MRINGSIPEDFHLQMNAYRHMPALRIPPDNLRHPLQDQQLAYV